MDKKWQNFLKNLGEWRGSFTKISPEGEIISSTPSILNLDSFDNDQGVLFRIRRFGEEGYEGIPTQDYQQEYRTLGRQIIFFDRGAFSKGSLLLAPFAEFAAEYGFVDDDRRLRFVQFYDKEANFNSLTLIREFRSNTEAYERPSLTVDQLIGSWEGKAYINYADWRDPQSYDTYLTVKDLGNNYLEQTLSFQDQVITSKAKIENNKLIFEGENPRLFLLLPDGASINIPLKLQRHQAFFVEAGWLVRENERQRIMRSYDNKGEWINSTHIIEQKK
jgi:hypothetical protein